MFNIRTRFLSRSTAVVFFGYDGAGIVTLLADANGNDVGDEKQDELR